MPRFGGVCLVKAPAGPCVCNTVVKEGDLFQNKSAAAPRVQQARGGGTVGLFA